MLNAQRVTKGIMPEPVQRRCKAAFAMLALEQRAFAESRDIDHYRVSKMINGAERVTDAYVGPLNKLLDQAQEELASDADCANQRRPQAA